MSPRRRVPAGHERLALQLREEVFRLGRPTPPRRIGAEVELLPVDARGAMLPIDEPGLPSSLPLLRRVAAREGWEERRTPGGAPLFAPRGGGSISYEPGGQIEFSSPACSSVTGLLSALSSVVQPLQRAAEREGVRLLSLGIQPSGTAEEIPLQLGSERYARMAGYLAGVGPFGALMMKQTASMQVNLDWEDDPLGRWRLLNAAAPYLAAIFANSPLYGGADTGVPSYRSRVWQSVDPARTGVWDGRGDPVEGYLAFALGAPTILRPAEDGGHPPFGEWLARGDVELEEWRTHLTTLFPEVRPKGFVEVRCIDAVPPEWYAAPLVLLAGLAYHRPTADAALELLPPGGGALLRRAVDRGLKDPTVLGAARELFQLGLRGAAALGEPFIDASAMDTAQAYFERYTGCGRSPADDTAPHPQPIERIA